MRPGASVDAEPDVSTPPTGAGGGHGPPGPARRRVPWLVVGPVTAVVLVGAFVAGQRLAGPRASGPPPGAIASVRQVAGSAQSSTYYPGATVLPAGHAPAKPDLTLTDTAGQPYNLAARTAGRVTLVYFGYTNCPDTCPINMALAAAALGRMPAADRQKVTVAFVTTDPARDTPAVIRAWLDKFDPSFVGLTGSLAQIHQAEQEVGMPPSSSEVAEGPGGGYVVDHAGYTMAYSLDGLAHLQVDVTETPAGYATTIEHLVSGPYRPSGR
ncbi:MAG: SCO family protein [Acidimicrobiales bacterium]